MAFPKSIRTAWVATSVAPQGTSTANLTPFQVGMFNENHQAFTNGNFQSNRNIRFALGSPNSGQKSVGGKLGNFANINNVDISFKSQHVFGHNIDRVWVSKPVKTAKPFIGYIGFDDQNFTKTLTINPNKQYAIEVVVKGQPVRAIFGQDIRESFEFDGGCLTTTGTGSAATDNVTGVVINDLIRRLGDGYITSRFFKAEKVISASAGAAVSHYSAANQLYSYSLKVSDTGDALALAAVKNQYPTQTIVRDSRVGSVSIYKFTSATANFNNTSTLLPFTQDNVFLFDCPTGTCGSGYTTNLGYSLFNVTRARLNTDILTATTTASATTNTDATTLANFIGASYIKPLAFNAATSVDGTLERITIANHGLGTGQLVNYSALATTVVTGLTNLTNYYVIRIDANTISLASSLANALAGTAIGLTAVASSTHYLTPVDFAITGLADTALANNDTITANAHGLKSGDIVFYTYGAGATTTGGVTAMTVPYIVTYVNANTFKLNSTFANYLAGTFVDLTTSGVANSTHGFIKIPNSTMVITNTDNLTVAVKQGFGTTSLTPVATDTIVYEGGVKTYCSLTSPTSTNWDNLSGSTVSGVVIAGRATRNFTLTKKIDDCDGTNVATELAALQATYPTSLTVQAAPTASTNGCNVTYTMTAFSRPMDLDCDTTPTPIFDTPAAFKGFQWVPAAEAEVGAKTEKFGIKFTAAFVDQRTGGCSFDPLDAVTYDPVQLEVSMYELTKYEDFVIPGSPVTCVPYVADWTVTQYPTREELLGQSVLRDIIKSRRYNQEVYVSPSEELGGKFSKAEGLDYGVDVDAYYYAVHILHNVKKRVNNTASEPEQREEIVVYFPESAYTAMIQFVSSLDTYTSSAGIFMNPITI